MQFFIFHGAYGSKDGNWFPWLKDELEKAGHKAVLQQYPVDDFNEIVRKGVGWTGETKQNLNSWIEYFRNNAMPEIKPTEPVIFIGHSLAPVFMLHIVDRFLIELDSAVFVSPFLEKLGGEAWQFDTVNRTFFKSDFDWEKIRKLIPTSYVLYGEDDPYVPARFPLQLAEKMSSSVIPIRKGGHLGGDFKMLPIVLELLKTRFS